MWLRFRCGLKLRVTLRPKSLAICGRGWKATKAGTSPKVFPSQKALQSQGIAAPIFEGSLPSCRPHSVGYTLIQRIAKGAGGKGPRQKNVKNRQKVSKNFQYFSTIFAQGKKRQKVSKTFSTLFDNFRAAPFFRPLLGGSDMFAHQYFPAARKSSSESQKNVGNPNHHYFSNLCCNAPPICTSMRLQFVSQYFGCPIRSEERKCYQYSSQLYRSTPPTVLQHASHLYRNIFGKILVVVVTGMFPREGIREDFSQERHININKFFR